jgi:hypothetical protein
VALADEKMLALKTMKVAPLKTERLTGSHLPSEVLDLIAMFIYEGGCRQARALHAFSLTSKAFRRSGLLYILEMLTYYLDNESGSLRRFMQHPDLLSYVRVLTIARPSRDNRDHHPGKREEEDSDVELLGQALQRMSSLRRVK